MTNLFDFILALIWDFSIFLYNHEDGEALGIWFICFIYLTMKKKIFKGLLTSLYSGRWMEWRSNQRAPLLSGGCELKIFPASHCFFDNESCITQSGLSSSISTVCLLVFFSRNEIIVLTPHLIKIILLPFCFVIFCFY